MDELSPDDFYDYSAVLNAAVSPDGERVAFLVSSFDSEEDDRHTSLFVAPTDGSADPYRLTRASSASAPQWSPDGDRLAFIAARETDSELATENGADDEADEADDEASGDEGPVGEGPRPQV